jgi:uncharacterized protein (TIGR00369 family)
MKKIRNPFTDADSSRHEYNCFGCSPFNEIGLHLQFWEDGEEILAKWKPRKLLEGWKDILHGGIQATLIDELAGWIILLKKQTAGVTSSMSINYIKPVFISKGEITIKGRIISTSGRISKITCSLFDGEGIECVLAELEYYCFPEKIAREKYHYPGIQAFYES